MHHEPVLLDECIEGLNINPAGVYVDATYGGGGHTREILRYLKEGKVVAFDYDKSAADRMIVNDNLIFERQNFRFLKNVLRYLGVDKVDGILADLGLSSYQIDESARGFSFRFKSIMDMRMNTDAKMNAADILNQYDEIRLTKLFREYGEIHNAKKLSKKIIIARENGLIEDSEQFVFIINDLIPGEKKNQYLAKVYQALRIEVNKEIQNLRDFLQQIPDVLKSGGRLVVISYHSLEDRLVKQFIRHGSFSSVPEKDFYGNLIVPFKAVNNRVITPTPAEISRNNRARSAKLRIAERI